MKDNFTLEGVTGGGSRAGWKELDDTTYMILRK